MDKLDETAVKELYLQCFTCFCVQIAPKVFFILQFPRKLKFYKIIIILFFIIFQTSTPATTASATTSASVSATAATTTATSATAEAQAAATVREGNKNRLLLEENFILFYKSN